MSVKTKEAGFEQNKLVHEARALQDRADAEKRDMNAEEKQQFDALMDKVDKLYDQLNERDDENDEKKEKDDPTKEAESADKDKGGDERDDEENENRSLRRRLLAAHTSHLARSSGTVSKRHLNRELSDRYANAGTDGAELRRFNSSKRYQGEYRNWLRGGEKPREYRDMTLGTNTSGGYLVTPTKLSDDIVIAVNNLVFMRKMADIDRLTDAVSLGNPQLTSDVQGITWGAETVVSTADTSLALGRRDLTPNMATNLVKVSYRLLQASPRAEQLVAQRIAVQFAYGEEQAYMTGAGTSSVPMGIFTPSASGIPTSRDVTATGSSHAFVADDLFAVVYNIAQQYQDADTFGWFMHRNYVKQAVTLKDANQQYLWNVNGYISPLTGRRAATLCGFPVWQSEFAPYAAAATGNYVACLGDYKYYRIAETMDVEIQRLIELFALSGEIGFLARKFVDAAPVLPNAFARLILA